MMRTAHLAPYYGIARTRKALVEHARKLGVNCNPGAKPVRVLVYEVRANAAPKQDSLDRRPGVAGGTAD